MLKKSGSRTPRIELVEMGPRFDILLRRSKLASNDLWKVACKQPVQVQVKKTKNISMDVFGTKVARIHLGRQELRRIQTRKVKALKDNEKDGGNSSAKKKRRVEKEQE